MVTLAKLYFSSTATLHKTVVEIMELKVYCMKSSEQLVFLYMQYQTSFILLVATCDLHYIF